MTQIEAVRNYVKTQVQKTFPNKEEFELDVFGNNDIDRARMEKFYKLLVTDFEITEDANFRYRIYSCNLEIFKIGGFNQRLEYDAFLDDVESIQDNLYRSIGIDNADCIHRVEILSYEAIEEDTTESAYKISTNFNVYLGFI